MQATVILHVPPADVLDALPPIGDDAEQRRAANGETVRVRALEDCVALDLGRSLADEPLLLLARTVQLAGGPLVAGHDAERGIPAFPSSHALSATRWDAIVEELGEAAEWLPTSPPAQMPDLSAMFGAEGADIAAQLGVQLGGPQGAELMQSAMAMAQQLMAGGDLQALMGGGNLDIDALKGQAEAMLAADPDLARRIQGQLGAFFPGAEDEADPGGDDDEPGDDESR